MLSTDQKLKEVFAIIKSIDSLVEKIPFADDKTIKFVREKILKSKELNDLIYKIEHPRPPRIFIIGKTGIGKSSLINALIGKYEADTNPYISETQNCRQYNIEDNGKIKFQILDSRGISENQNNADEKCAEEQVVEEVIKFEPDIVLYLFDSRRDSMVNDIKLIKDVQKECCDKLGMELPLLGVMTQADKINPVKKICNEKENVINKTLEARAADIRENGLDIKDDKLLAVSSYVEWRNCEGYVYCEEELKELALDIKKSLVIETDERYHIDELHDMMLEAIKDISVVIAMGSSRNQRRFLRIVANKLVEFFSSATGAIAAAASIPVSDILIITPVQIFMVYVIAKLGKDVFKIQDAAEFIFSLFGVTGFAILSKIIVRYLLKLIPFVGSTINFAVAYGMTYAIGRSAIEFYIEGFDMEKVKKEFEQKISTAIELGKTKEK